MRSWIARGCTTCSACRRRRWLRWPTDIRKPPASPDSSTCIPLAASGTGSAILLNAYTSGTPLVVTAGQQDSRHAITDPLLQGDLVSIARPACKWAAEITSPDQIAILTHRAFQDCRATPRGPVFLSLPMDVMETTSSNRNSRDVACRSPARLRDHCPELAVELSAVAPGSCRDHCGRRDLVSRRVQGGRPTRRAARGSGVRLFVAGAHPVSDEPLSCGEVICRHGQSTLPRRCAISTACSRSAASRSSRSCIPMPPRCRMAAICIQLSVDGRDLGRTFPSKLSVVGDIELSLKAF